MRKEQKKKALPLIERVNATWERKVDETPVDNGSPTQALFPPLFVFEWLYHPEKLVFSCYSLVFIEICVYI